MSSLYFIGIGGTAMASVAVALSHLGHAITGSDTGLYPPMSTYLDEHHIRYFSGFSADNLQSVKPDMVVVGNAVSRGNEELEYALNEKMELVAMPDLVRRELIGKNTSIVVAGTHGKTTTTSIVAWLLESGGLRPGFLVGGIPENFGIGCRPSGRSDEGFFVSEGDEYDTAFFDKRSKFMLYRPDIAIINNIEFDHADIFSSLEEIKRSFRLLVNLIPSNGALIVNGDDPVAMEVSSKALCRVETFGLTDGCDWTAQNIRVEENGSSFDLYYKGGFERRFNAPLFGSYNILNTLASIAVATLSGMTLDMTAEGLREFLRPKRRMETVGTYEGNITVIEDFAHHPTAIRVTLEAIKERWPERRIITCFEARSNTTTRNIFQKELAECFGPADIVVLGKVHRPERYGPEGSLDTARLKKELEEQGKTVFLGGSDPKNYPADIVGFLESCRKKDDVVLMLTNGSFAGLKTALTESFQKKR
ncbi:UDP-N-acetylmuramate--alanine ligase [Chlorobium phaeovibrioides]|uniref:UDP-N-acetylmuramate--alanine ligase n=2 Tax=Chlorobium phaeovibrioides TaxID=1094 RepID=A0A432AV85_CHLPH|nr:Mur ligase family protein [Chlorobium phaeovibrioides]MWV53963.1 UDP-N-acetylmuramate--alanine ligase [Chlorobium phaeovibrioides]RTY38854.1 UDP-N-acetylmuramate--alanine ligase [Chlorobium phaeovibrioides]HCD36183.1 UDP-N-acetylmuramate--alanine ligase [Chlorobium sp.]